MRTRPLLPFSSNALSLKQEATLMRPAKRVGPVSVALAAMFFISLPDSARATDSGIPLTQVTNSSPGYPAPCSRAEVRPVEDALRVDRSLERHCSSLQTEHGPGFSYAEYTYRRYKMRRGVGAFLVVSGLVFAPVAIGTGIAWARTPEEEPVGFWSILSEKDELGIVCLSFSLWSLALLVSGTVTLVVVNPKLERMERLVNDGRSDSGRSPVLALEPFVYGQGGGGQLRISF